MAYRNAHGKKRIGTISWASHVFYSGSGETSASLVPNRSKSLEVTKVRFAVSNRVPDGGVHASILTSGGNDSKICIWDLRGSTRDTSLTTASNSAASSISSGGQQVTSGIHYMHLKKAAVKGLAWNPGVWRGCSGSMYSDLEYCYRENVE
ncbi:hypothetical protein F5876DRAFT_69351 [Lentinula aff. lateritia]|uniref:Uncharacterized protein n=1 Tax=Lentinula aff. lateritia TaxID=2804960 RepID=A0ACC1TMJ4_9AGAR|nr:hypothetical protein F5876DRAFT_69351 [Lentinula aff. lateritia]